MEQRHYPRSQRLPILTSADLTPKVFGDYLDANKPNVVLTNFENAAECMKQLKIAIPRDLGLASLSATIPDDGASGINENAFAVGEAALELVATMIQRNEFGIPVAPRCVMIAGSWVQGRTVRRVDKPVKDLMPSPDDFQYRNEPLSAA